ncbi:MAG: MarR family transcriptional regulator [Alphaproteobacteria bacterium]|nr:MarR family transcriptional regulator [Alphaproteobacteria bacterium]
MPVRPAHTALFPHIDLDGTRLTVIAERAGISKQAVGQLVDDLVAMGALERVPDPADGRARLVRFVGGGSALLHGLSVLGALESDLAGIVGGDALAAMHATLQAVDDALDAGTLTPGEGTG